MRPCAKNRKRIAALSLEILEPPQAQDLRRHIESCAGCRGYWTELSQVVDVLERAEVKSDVQTSQRFHRRLASALQREEQCSARSGLAALIRATVFNWRAALPLVGAGALLWLVLTLARPPGLKPAPSAALASLDREPSPTVANYERVANRSFDEFDDLLTRQGNRPGSSAPVYTASMPTLALGSD